MYRFNLILCVIYAINAVISEPISDFTKPNTPPKYFGIDINDTFYVEDSDKFKKNVEAFKKLKDNNITPFFCTGNLNHLHVVGSYFESAKDLIIDKFESQLSYNGFPGVYSAGCVVFDPDGNHIRNIKFEEDFLKKFVEGLKNNVLLNKTYFGTADGAFSLKEMDSDVINYERTRKRNISQTTYDDLKTKGVYTIYYYGDHFEVEGYTKGVHYNCYEFPNNEKDLTPVGCDKKEGTKALLDHLKSNFDECAFVGDGDNDKEIMKACRLSFAVGNAKDDVKKSAKWVSDLNHDQGAFEQIVNALVQ